MVSRPQPSQLPTTRILKDDWLVRIDVLTNGACREPRSFLSPARLTLGRAESCDVHFGAADSAVADVHAELVRGVGGYTLRAMRGTSGIVTPKSNTPRTEIPLSSSMQATEVRLGPSGPTLRIQVGVAFRFANYIVTGRLGEGGMGTVYVARETDAVRHDVVLKIIKPSVLSLMDEDEAKARNRAEAWLLSRSQHPNVVCVYEAGNYEGCHYIAMEHLHGVDLANIQRQFAQLRVRCPPTLVAALISQACHGLHAAHEATDETGRPLRLVHRDVTPSNIVVLPSGHVKLIDFGVARADKGKPHSNGSYFVGKPAYASPEQIENPKGIDRRSDLFSVGILLHELCRGRYLFLHSNDLQAFRAVCSAPIPEIPDIPAALMSIIRRALSRDLSQRYNSAEELAAELERFVLSQGGAHLQQHAVASELRRLGIQLTATRPNLLSERPSIFPLTPATQPSAPPVPPPVPTVPNPSPTPPPPPIPAGALPIEFSLEGTKYRRAQKPEGAHTGLPFPHEIFAIESDKQAAAKPADSERLLIHAISSNQLSRPLGEPERAQLKTLAARIRAAAPERAPFGRIIAVGEPAANGPSVLVLGVPSCVTSWAEQAARPEGLIADRSVLFAELARTVAALSAIDPGLAHGDLNPESVLITTEPGAPVRILFRLPSDLRHFLGANPATQQARTGIYLAPERLSGAAPTPSSDVYSAACLIVELLGLDLQQLQPSLRRGGRLPLLALPSGTPETMNEALRAALSCDPALRPQPSEFARLVIRLGTEPTAGAPRSYPMPRPGSPVKLTHPDGRGLSLSSLALDQHRSKSPVRLPLGADSDQLNGRLSVTPFLDRIAIDLDETGSAASRVRLYHEGASAGATRILITDDSGAFDVGNRSQNRLQRVEYIARLEEPTDLVSIPSLSIALSLPQRARTVTLWSRDIRNGDTHLCCIELAG